MIGYLLESFCPIKGTQDPCRTATDTKPHRSNVEYQCPTPSKKSMYISISIDIYLYRQIDRSIYQSIEGSIEKQIEGSIEKQIDRNRSIDWMQEHLTRRTFRHAWKPCYDVERANKNILVCFELPDIYLSISISIYLQRYIQIYGSMDGRTPIKRA